MLYSYEAALKAVPSEGDWRLPTDEDWKKLERFLGMSEGEVPKDNDWRGTNQAEYLKADKNGIGFNVLYGGGKIYTPRYNKMEDDQTFINKGRNAYFWSSENLAETDSTRGELCDLLPRGRTRYYVQPQDLRMKMVTRQCIMYI